MVAMITSGQGKLDRSANVTLSGAGLGRVTLGPVPSGQVWAITRITIQVSGANNPMPTCKVYDGPVENPGNLIDSTYTAAQNTSDFGTPYQLNDQEQLLFVFAGGVPGSVATARVVGVQQSA